MQVRNVCNLNVPVNTRYCRVSLTKYVLIDVETSQFYQYSSWVILLYLHNIAWKTSKIVAMYTNKNFYQSENLSSTNNPIFHTTSRKIHFMTKKKTLHDHTIVRRNDCECLFISINEWELVTYTQKHVSLSWGCLQKITFWSFFSSECGTNSNNRNKNNFFHNKNCWPKRFWKTNSKHIFTSKKLLHLYHTFTSEIIIQILL